MLALVLLLVLTPKRALAEEGAPPSIDPTLRLPEEFEPPHLLFGPNAPFPENVADEDAFVTLKLLISSEGLVEQAQILEGQFPFTEVALTLSRQFVFVPARVRGKARAAWVRVAIPFSPKTPESAPPHATMRLVSGGMVAPTPHEVSVRGVRRSTMTRTVTDNETHILPGAEGDPVRAIEATPGVVPVLASGPFMGLRGAPPGMVGYEYDGIPVPYLFHLARGAAVVHPWAVDSALLYGTLGPARLGRAVGGVLEARSGPPSGRTRAMARLRLTDAALGVETPFANGRGNVLLAGRYSYTAPLVSLVAPRFALDYWDYQAKASYAVTPRETFEFLAFGASDLSGERRDDGTVADLFNGSFHRVSLRYREHAANGDETRYALTYGRDSWDANSGFIRPYQNTLNANFLRTIHFGPRSVLETGADLGARLQKDDFVTANPETVGSFERTDLMAAGYVNLSYLPSERFLFEFGLRADLFSSSATEVSQAAVDGALQPRFSMAYEPAPGIQLHNSFGYGVMPPTPAQRPPGRTLSIEGGLEHAVLSDAGVDFKLPSGFQAGATVFHNAYLNTNDVRTLRPLQDQVAGLYDVPGFARGRGQSFGLELSVRRTFGARLRGLFSYTVMHSWRSVGRVRGPAELDRTNVFDLALAYDLGAGFQVSSRATYYTGFPARMDTVRGASAPPRTTPYYQVDVQVLKRFRVGPGDTYWAISAGMLNATLNLEANDATCVDGVCTQNLIGPATIPTLGLEGEI